MSACALSRRRKSTTMWYCLPDSLSLLVYNPETSSRVTLALLGTVFQTALTVLARHVQNQSRITRCDGSVLHWFCFYVNWYAPLRRFDLYGFSLAGVYPRRTGANTIRIQSKTKWQHKIKRNPFNPFNPCSFNLWVFSNADLSDWCGLFLAGVYPAPYRRKQNLKEIQDQVYLRIKKSVKKKKSVASALSVFDFERGERAKGEGAIYNPTFTFYSRFSC